MTLGPGTGLSLTTFLLIIFVPSAYPTVGVFSLYFRVYQDTFEKKVLAQTRHEQNWVLFAEAFLNGSWAMAQVTIVGVFFKLPLFSFFWGDMLAHETNYRIVSHTVF